MKVCPKCRSIDVDYGFQQDDGSIEATYECHDCGYKGKAGEFELKPKKK